MMRSNIDFLCVDLSAESESESVSLSELSGCCASSDMEVHGCIGRFRTRSLPSGVWYSVARVAVAGKCLVVEVCVEG